MAVSDEQIARINFLARKAKGEGLTLDERQEQIELRQAYIKAVKESLTPLLDSIRVVEVTEEIDVVSVQMDGQTTEIEAVYMERVEERVEERLETGIAGELPGILPETGDDTVA